MPELILFGAVSFNAILAVINGHVFALQRIHVVLTEVAIYGLAVVVIAFNADRRMRPWLLLSLFIIAFGFLLALANGAFSPKYLRDVLVIPVFVMLGMTCRRATLVKPILAVQTVVCLVAILEVVRPDLYAELFRVLEYYVNTRDFSENQFWNTDSTLFVSATRPGERFFGFVEMHRLSSIFLEPVSLGNFCVVTAIVVVACWGDMAGWTKLYLVASTMMLLIGCDGRLAAASILIILILMAFFRKIPSRWSVAYLPSVLLASAVYVWAFHADSTGDTFGGRLASSLLVLSQMDVWGLLGLDAQSSNGAVDSGIAYFLLTQSLIGVAIIWLCISLVPDGRDWRSCIYVHAICVFIPLNLMVSYSFFSIKVAALIWFCYGHVCVQGSAYEAESDTGTRQLSTIDVVA